MLATPIASTDIKSTVVSSSTAVFGSASQRETFSVEDSVARLLRGVVLPANSFPILCRMEKVFFAVRANLDFLFIDFVSRRSEYGSNDCR
ncbi:hypothetical protein QA649_12435 [Bradyrhizobium sp. CB1717]|uniref:hypothetical protein n=1 Tax=Bradyrhizobium sp. CB1717 TaxID=3039154 RepID=UPI0024B26265|nr:hypothetical protein [Bradyrhizobium sp. CB1717]WFU26972.1 hypothetical protein QA649_12435 [Bradyrhizobium sp. CB1717]